MAPNLTPEDKERMMTPTPPVETPELSPTLRMASLTRREENTVIELRRNHAYTRCAEAMRTFSECSTEYTVGVVWKCKELKDIMNECLRRANTVEDMDRARTLVLHKKMQRLEEKKNKPRTLIDEAGFIRSYYGRAGAESTLQRAHMREQLPAHKHRLQLLYAIETYPVTIVVGEPGSGKSTQLPQYLYEADWAADGKTIACTQPRRVAAAMLAQRVADEMSVELGTTVGYSVRFSDASNPQQTRIKYMTDGTLVRECLADPLLSAYSVVVVDEAQDRSIATDTLLALLKKILVKRKNDLRVVVSSASLDAEQFQAFFGLGSSAIVTISGQQFPVDTHYLAAPCESYLTSAVEAVISIHEHEPPGDILVFLPGKDDIAAAIDEVGEQIHRNRSLESLVPLPMHAGLSVEEQKAVFDPLRSQMRKVVFSTNVAETSVTIDGILYVVDCGFVKQR
ncbi:ATPdependent RNA helicase, partial [Coemansia sp. RSA 2702]